MRWTGISGSIPADSANTFAHTESPDDQATKYSPHVTAHHPDDERAYPLSFRVESAGAGKAREYRVDISHPYLVVRQGALGREELGTCAIEGTPGSYVVLPHFAIASDPANAFFWAVWEIDGASVASLKHVLLTTEAFSGE